MLEKLVESAIKEGIGVNEFAHILIQNGICEKLDEALKVSSFVHLKHHSIFAQKLIMNNPAVDRKMWRYTGTHKNDSEHCLNHAKMDGQIVSKGRPFTLVGLDGKTYYPMYPHDPILPLEERIDCKCICQEIVADNVLGMSLEEHDRLVQKIRDEDDGAWERELDEQNKAKAGIVV